MQTDYPDFLIDAVPGARELAQDVEKLEAAAKPLATAVRAAMDARAGKVIGKRHGPSENDVWLVPVDGVSTAEVDALNAAKAEAEAAQSAHARKVNTARRAFAEKVQSLSRDERRAIARPVALAAHAEAVEALSKLDVALRTAHDTAPLNVDDYDSVYKNGFSLVRTRGFGAEMGPHRALEVLRAHLDVTAPHS